ncbi:MAG: hypothetical protein AB8H80_18035 [Planctomycetota bacterium]
MNKALTSLLLAALVGFVAPLQAQEDSGKTRKKSPVKVEMEKLDESLDAVAAFLEKPAGAAPMQQVAAAQAALQEAKKHPPRTLEQQPEEKRAAFLAAYKVEMNKNLRLVLDLEDALLQKDWEAAKTAMAAIKKLKKSAHRTYKGRRRRRK